MLFLRSSFVLVALGFGFYHWKRVVTPEWDDDTSFRFQRSATGELIVGAISPRRHGAARVDRLFHRQ